ncbi:MAG: adenylate/guanylate cyclase domain-containing protein [Leisingera sp.]
MKKAHKVVETRPQRHVAAILAADVVGYSRLMELDEADTFSRLTVLRKELFEPEVERHNGRIFKLMGDGLLVEFDSVVNAVECAVALQTGLAERNRSIDEDRHINARIGINVGDVIIEEDDRHGEGVIIASRLQELAEPGGIWLSQQAYDQLGTRLDATFEDIGERIVKNIAKAVHVYRLVNQTGQRQLHRTGRQWPRFTLAASLVIAMVLVAGAAFRFWSVPDGEYPPLPSGPKIAIVPFSDLGGPSDGAPLADGLTEDIATTLSKFSDLFVYSLNATIQYKGQPVDPRRIGEELGAEYVLEGSIRRSDKNLRVTAKLLDANSAQRIWSETYNRDLTATGIFAVLDEITQGVVATIGSATGVIRLKELERVQSGRPESLTAYECTARVAWYRLALSQERRAHIRACLEETVEIDPNYSKAWGELANILLETYKNETFSEAEANALLERADAAARKATEIDNSNEMGYYIRAIVSQIRGESYETFKELVDRTLEVNPNNADVVGDLGNFSFYSGDWERGKALVGRMMELNPRYPTWAHFVFFLDHFRKEEFPEALTAVLKINLPQMCMVQWATAAAYGQAGEREKGLATLEHISQIEPPCPEDPREPFRKRRLPDELVESIVDGLRKAGLEEGHASR